MKVILKEDIPSLGSNGDVVKVADGYGRNYLIPKGLALIASPQNLKAVEEKRKAQEKRTEKLKGEALKLSKEIEAISCNFSIQVGDDGKLFGSITSLDIEKFLKEKGYSIDKKDILLEGPIKSLGTLPVQIKLHPEVKTQLKVSILRSSPTTKDESVVPVLSSPDKIGAKDEKE